MTIQVQVGFQFTYNEDSKDINFTLICNSTGGQANSVVWTRDGFLLHNTGPLVRINASFYTNVLMVSDRTPGTYICTIRDQDDQVSGSASVDVQGKN